MIEIGGVREDREQSERSKARKEIFEQKREQNLNRGTNGQSQPDKIDQKMREKRKQDAQMYQSMRNGTHDTNMRW